MKIVVLPILLLIMLSTSCNTKMQKNQGTPLARVGNDYLYEDDIKSLLPPHTKPLDSIVWVRNYTNNWVKTKVFINKAKKNLKPEQLNFKSQLDKYRNSLIMYTYETELIKQQLDTIVTEAQLKEYYRQHKNEFILVKNIVRSLYAVINNDKKVEKHFKKLFMLPDTVILDSLEYNCKLYATDYFLDTAIWIPFDEVLKTIPLKTYNQELFLKNNRFISLKDKDNIYMIKFVDFKIKNDFSPLELEQDNIRNIIINNRKMVFIKSLHTKLYNDAALKNEFEIYTYDK